MSENINIEALQTTLVEDVETETVEELTLESIVDELIGTTTEFSPYKMAKLINLVFQATSTDKEIPPQMMYIYASKGMLAGKESKGRKIYTADEVRTFVLKYTAKHVTI